MEVKKTGTYRLLKPWSSMGGRSIAHYPIGTILFIDQIDTDAHKIIGPQLSDWEDWELPVEEAKP